MRRLLTVCMMMISWAAVAGPPAAGGVCDDLKGGTPGLYGLCVAYCEAQGLGDPELAEAKQSAFSLLRAYERKRGPGDPDMPCLAEAPREFPPPPQAECPCWDVDTLRMALPQPTRCQTGADVMAMSQEAGGAVSVALVQFPFMQFGRFCQLQDGINHAVPDAIEFGLDDAAVEGCQALWTYHATVTDCPSL